MGAKQCLDPNQLPIATVVTNLATSRANWEMDVHSESLLLAFLGGSKVSGSPTASFLSHIYGICLCAYFVIKCTFCTVRTLLEVYCKWNGKLCNVLLLAEEQEHFTLQIQD